MADSQEEEKSPKADNDFMDPLGANDPLSRGLEDGFDDVEYDILPIKSCELDAVLAQNRQQMLKLKLEDESDDLDNETRDLFVVVDNPEKHVTTLESYMTFRVTTKTTRPEYEGQEFQVRRRYNDFVWLRQRLEETQSTHIVPPLPEKHSLRRLERFSPEFVKTRQHALQKFMTRITDHPVMSYNKFFHTFLTAKQWEFQAAKKEGSGFMSRVADSFHNMSAAYMMKNRPAEFTQMTEYIGNFSEKLAVLDRIAQRISKEQYEYLAELNEWGPVFTLWSNSEDSVALSLRATASAVAKNFLALQELIENTESQMAQPLREYMLYVDCVKTVLRRRDAIQYEYEMTHEELDKKKDEREQHQVEEVETQTGSSYSLGSLLGKSPDTLKKDKQEKLDAQIAEVTKQVEDLNDKTVCANADLKADIERWHKHKRRDFRALFVEMADQQIQYYQQCLRAWEDTLAQIKRSDQASSTSMATGGDSAPSDSASSSPPASRTTPPTFSTTPPTSAESNNS